MGADGHMLTPVSCVGDCMAAEAGRSMSQEAEDSANSCLTQAKFAEVSPAKKTRLRRSMVGAGCRQEVCNEQTRAHQ